MKNVFEQMSTFSERTNTLQPKKVLQEKTFARECKGTEIKKWSSLFQVYATFLRQSSTQTCKGKCSANKKCSFSWKLYFYF